MIEEQTNIAMFDTTVLYLSDILYQNFPRCIDINVYEEILKEPFSNMREDDIGKQTMISETMFFLSENGFIRFSVPDKRGYRIEDSAYFSCARLTAKGLLILKSKPKSITTHESIGQKIKAELKTRAVTRIADASSELMMNIINGLG